MYSLAVRKNVPILAVINEISLSSTKLEFGMISEGLDCL
jgi:hypothetical protein